MKRNIVIATVAAATLIGGTVAAYAVGNDGGAPTQSPSGTRVADDRAGTVDDRTGDRKSGNGSAARPAGAKVSAADAITAALKNTPGTAVGVSLDDDGTRAWEVDVVRSNGTERDVRVSTSTGKVLGAHRDDSDDRDDHNGRGDLARLKGTSVDAREAAVAGAARGTVTDVDLDDDGPRAWSVKTAKGEFKVDLKTGKVTQSRDDRRGHDDSDDRDDRAGHDDRGQRGGHDDGDDRGDDD
ncbi:hypothetical protein SZN_15283 [Streptomyces zinciresistens K42]|uniref:PepSY domain-containing protein n=1 Tax=Streptomyces zinciresistens K42 TaxID=700597 RepID=G2GC32_9ACTN|nr:PepSY domain-containing protein [Streptomyces zinciresistens]EGX58956.1 hypothetical protein SZN_15283 [Streptomyces zinciresistens K42]